MKKEKQLLQMLHKNTSRDYLARMKDRKVHCMEVASRFDHEYWDGERCYGYGGYHYDGRWKPFAQNLIEHYSLSSESKILDLGCGKAHLLFELKKLLPKLTITGLDISHHAIEKAPQEIQHDLKIHDLRKDLPYNDDQFDLVISLNTIHNFNAHEGVKILQEMDRVGKEKYLVVESYRSIQELFNLQCWALTCKSFFSPEDWQWLFEKAKYSGDFEFIYFE